MTGHGPRRQTPAGRAHLAPASKTRTAPAGETAPPGETTPAAGTTPPGETAPAGGTTPPGETGPVPAILVAAVASAAEADQAISAGADMIDASGLTERDLAALRTRHPGVRLWHGSPATADADDTGHGNDTDDNGHTDDTGHAGIAGIAAAAGHNQSTAPAGRNQSTAAAGQARSTAAVVARAAVLTWLGTPAIRTRHVLPVRRAIDMTCAIAGTRLPALTTRGLG